MMSSLVRSLRGAIVALTALGASDTAAHAQDGRLPVPYGIGERLEYDVHFGNLRVGSGAMEVMGFADVRGRETWHTVFSVQGGLKFVYRVNDRYESWIDTHTGNSLRYRQDLNEGRRDVERNFEFFPERGVYIENGQTEKPSVSHPLDDGSFIYFIRSIPLIVGETYSFERYFIPDRNPVSIRVLRRERIRVPAGEFNAIVIQPVIKSKGIFSENGRAEVWLSDDDARIMLQMKSALSFGSLNLYLKSHRPARARTSAP
jgi:hypothetical protein